jgi:branched-chain amino acid transport system permease protein
VTLQSWFGPAALALDTALYGLLLILFIIYMPKGILGTLMERRQKKAGPSRPGSSITAPAESGAKAL